jgi:hypothetical protein
MLHAVAHGRMRSLPVLAAIAVLAVTTETLAHAQTPLGAPQDQPPPAPAPAPTPAPGPALAPPPAPEPAPIPHFSKSAPPGSDYPSAPPPPPPPPPPPTETVDVSGLHPPPLWKPGDPVPPGYRETKRIRTGLVVAGSITFVGVYFASLFAALTSEAAQDGCPQNPSQDSSVSGCHPPLSDLFIPGVGPFVQMAHSWNTAAGDVLLGIDGVAQLAGLTMIVIGVASPQRLLVRSSLGPATAGIRWQLAPLVSRGREGLSLVGTF